MLAHAIDVVTGKLSASSCHFCFSTCFQRSIAVCKYSGDNVAMPIQTNCGVNSYTGIEGLGFDELAARTATLRDAEKFFWCPAGVLNARYLDDFIGMNLTGVMEMCADPAAYLAPFPGSNGALLLGSNAGGEIHAFTEESALDWCVNCVTFGDASTGHVLAVDTLMQFDVQQITIASMGYFDWVALMLACFMVSCTVVGEVRVVQHVASLAHAR
jgi:hypothetical protein